VSQPTERKRTLLLVDDDPETVEDTAAVLERLFTCIGVSDPDDVVPAYLEHRPDAVLLDIIFGDAPLGYDLLDRLRAVDPHLPVLMWSEDVRMKTGLTAQERGAYGVIRKTPTRGEIVPAIEACLRGRRREIACATLSGEAREHAVPLVAADVGLSEVYRRAMALAETDGPVLITGEPGVGRRRLAREMHRKSRRRSELLVSCDCRGTAPAGLPAALFGWIDRRGDVSVFRPGLCDAADDGTLFLDEADGLTPNALEGLKELLDEKRYRAVGDTVDRRADVRVIASAGDPGGEEPVPLPLRDLFGDAHLRVPPLRERPDDIVPLAEAFVTTRASVLGRELAATSEALAFLASRSWQGNVEELRTVVEGACDAAAGPGITRADLESLVG
jgi:DNA-binding NtrC family response regulator